MANHKVQSPLLSMLQEYILYCYAQNEEYCQKNNAVTVIFYIFPFLLQSLKFLQENLNMFCPVHSLQENLDPLVYSSINHSVLWKGCVISIIGQTLELNHSISDNIARDDMQ